MLEITMTEAVGPEHKPARKAERPDPEWVRGECPCCGGEVVSNAYWVGGKGYKIVWECWEGLGTDPTCNYRRVL